MNRLNETLRAINANAGSLTRRQVKTLRGQAMAGDIDGTMKGLENILKRKE